MALTVKMNEKKTELTITIPVNAKPEPSATGKTLLVASTHGTMKSEIMVDGKPLQINLSAYIKADKKAE